MRMNNNEDEDPDESVSLYSDKTTIEYSWNFHRHVVRDAEQRRVLESFLWLDEAMEKYPHAERIAPSFMNAKDWINFQQQSVIDQGIQVAGAGLMEFSAYPFHSNHTQIDSDTIDPMEEKRKDDHDSNVRCIYHVLESLLKWYPRQVDRLCERWPPLAIYPAALLEERLKFLLAPLPDNDKYQDKNDAQQSSSFLHRVNITEDIDWPKLFYCEYRGAGMSIGQVSHALQTLPEPFLLRWHPWDDWTNSNDNDDDDHVNDGMDQQSQKYHYVSTMKFLYEQTPSVVLQMAYSVLDLWVTGTTNMDVISLAYLHWKGWEWQACRIVLHAFPYSQQCSLDLSWDLIPQNSSNTGIRKHLIPEALAYLRMRLQLRPWHIHAMLKTHTRLTGYSAAKLKANIDYLEENLGMKSKDTRALLLLMPSLLGASLASLETRMLFWKNRVGIENALLRKVVQKKPALLQYSVEDNLLPKWEFFTQQLGLNPDELVKMTKRNPELWGRSLDRYWIPLIQIIRSHLKDENGQDMTYEECGRLFYRLPDILRFSSRSINDKLQFLGEQLTEIETHELKAMLLNYPQILAMGIQSSLHPKIVFLESVVGKSRVSEYLKNNPILLTISMERFRERIQSDAWSTNPIPVSVDGSKDLSSKNFGRRTRKTVQILTYANNKTVVEREFGSVLEAATFAEIPKAKMYTIIRSGRLVDGRKYVYAGNLDQDAHLRENHAAPTGTHKSEDSAKMSQLIIYSSGRAFPPEDTVRGRRRAGGMALQIHNWTSTDWKQSCSNLWKGTRLRLLPDEQTLIIGYHYLRPSRRRCSLYAAFQALRVAREWLKQISSHSAVIHIASDSNYVVNLLKNTTQLFEWGRAEKRKDFVVDGQGNPHEVNPDILFPLSRLYFRLIQQDTVDVALKKNVTVVFTVANACESQHRLYDGAKLAAKLMYDIVK
jgi:hypothetical protein